MKKAGRLYLLLVPQTLALALPIIVERATQKPTPNDIQYPYSPLFGRGQYIHPNRHLPLLCSLTMIEFARFGLPKTKRQINAFPQNMHPHLSASAFGLSTRGLDNTKV